MLARGLGAVNKIDAESMQNRLSVHHDYRTLAGTGITT